MDAPTLRQADLPALESVAVEIVERAAQTLRERFAAGVADEQVQFKDKRQRDPVTAVDKAVEALVRAELRARFPSHGMLGEEGTGDAVESRFLWVLDPIDGTANFAAKLPFYGLSLALLYDGVPVVGCLLAPFWPGSGHGAVLHASLGHGARISGEPVRLRSRTFRPGGPVALPPGWRAMFTMRGALAQRQGEARNLGSIVAEIAMVATGGFQYAVFGAPRLWDVAAGVVVVREAGGHVLTWDRGKWRHLGRFRAPAATAGKQPPTLRDWVKPVLVTGPGVVRHVAEGLAPHQPPPLPVRWAIKQRKAVRAWWRERGKAQTATPAEPGADQGPSHAAPSA
ncbi:MAG: inositol monophosphatase [Dehalococcoidia bacterium]|nr:inositol monophosphatase [Dehalococcoidia bacterium]